MSRLHALIIDDNKDNAQILAELINLEGGTSTVVMQPAQLPNILPTIEKVDVVFIDLEMPMMDGYAVARLLRNDPSFAKTPQVAYTVHVSEMNVVKTRGFNGFLGKLVDADRFPAQLGQILAGGSVWTTH